MIDLERFCAQGTFCRNKFCAQGTLKKNLYRIY